MRLTTALHSGQVTAADDPEALAPAHAPLQPNPSAAAAHLRVGVDAVVLDKHQQRVLDDRGWQAAAAHRLRQRQLALFRKDLEDSLMRRTGRGV